ncbi:MAG: hypothetical protein AAGI53_14525 [Planctomycetota bacterium]
MSSLSDNPEAPTCWKCGYDLRGLGPTDVCPECGEPVSFVRGWDRDRRMIQWSTWLGVAALVSPVFCLWPLMAPLSLAAIGTSVVAHRRVRRGQISYAEFWPSLVGAFLGVGALLGWGMLFVISIWFTDP